MKKTNTFLVLFLLLFVASSEAQTVIFSENMGNPSETKTIATNTFQNSNTLLSYSNGNQTNSADIRTSSSSSGNTNDGNVFFSSSTVNGSTTYGFSIEGINAANYTSLSLEYKYRKEALASHATFTVEYWNGTLWTKLASTADSNIFSQLNGASTGWYSAITLSLPIDAQFNGLRIRFIKTGTTAIRIDDVKLTGTLIVPTVTNTTITNTTSNSATFAGNVTATGGIPINASGTVFATTTTNAAPTIGGAGVTTLATPSPNIGTGTFSNNSGTVLLPNVQYSYNAFATNSASGTGYGTVATFYTLAATPLAPSINSTTATSLIISIGSGDTNSTATTYAIFETNTTKFVQANGTLGTNSVYQTATAWGNTTVTGLTPSTTYSFQVHAKNMNDTITSPSTLSSSTTLALPSITTSGTLTGLSTTYGTASILTTSFSVSATNLTGNLVITPPACFEISQTVGGTSGYAPFQTVNTSSGTVALITLYIRLSASTPAGIYSENIITLANNGLTESIATATSVVTKLNATITGVTASNKVCDGTTIATLTGTPSLIGILSSDSSSVALNTGAVTANFADTTVGNTKAVTVSGYTISGTAAANYNLIQPTGLTANITANANSDIVLNNSSPTSGNININYRSYQGNNLGNITNTSSSIGVMGFYLRDGGGLNDGDNLGTVLTAITFNVEGGSNIRYARLFDTNAAIGDQKEVITVNGNSTITFTGLNIVAADNFQFPLNLRVTFKNTVNDNEQMKFTIASVTAGTEGSKFAAFNGGGASSRDDLPDINKIEVTASKLEFVSQLLPEYFAKSNMNPSPSVIARDLNNNIDEDFKGNVSMTSSGTLSGPQSITATATAGVATFNAINHSVAGTALVLTGTAPGLDPAISNTFTIIPLIFPNFNPVDPICIGATLSALPTTSTNGIVGTWAPELNNNATTFYEFTPDAGQNATNTTLSITVNPIVTPTFTPIAPITSGSTISPLPTTSNNGIIGTWSPALNNTATTTYSFAPASGQCAITETELIISVDPTNIDTPVSPSLDQNYIITRNYKIPTQTSISSPSPDKAQVSITYFDGLGRPMQHIANQQSSTGKDIITYIEYDDFGRQDKDYLPFESSTNNMAYDSNAFTGVHTFYNAPKYENTANPYSKKEFEASPLNRVLKQAAPGNDWALRPSGLGHEIKFEYQTNQPSDAVKNYKATVSELYEIGLIDDGIYQPNELYKTITYDENTSSNPLELDGSTVEFKNKEGQVILKRTYDNNNPHDTYYVYDVYGNLTYVIPPLVTDATDSDQKSNLCYQYKYDYRNRLVEKKLPGKQWEFIVYDKLDRPVATGPALSPFGDSTWGWLITKYDVFNRPVYTGWKNEEVTSSTRASKQNTQNALTAFNESKHTADNDIDGKSLRYTKDIAPTDFKLLTVNYYDDYNFPNAAPIPSYVQGQTVLTNVKGLATGSWTRVLTGESEVLGETATTFYDAKARPIRNYLKNYLDGFTITDSNLELISGQLNYTITEHQRSTIITEKITVKENFTYSPQGRLLTHTHEIVGNPQGIQLLATNTYDALGQLISKGVGNTVAQPLQKVDYSYNIRGWLTGINNDSSNNVVLNNTENDLFGFKINYNTVEDEINYDGTALYNGNISETYWRTSGDGFLKKYGYQYDDLNRLKNAIYQRPGAGTIVTNSYNESLTYDKNGNIKSLQRNGNVDVQENAQNIDDLTYTYSSYSNQLLSVGDNGNTDSGFIDGNQIGNDYTYDDNGNLQTDTNKGIVNSNAAAITYNHLNLPTKITFGTKGTIIYIYNANGIKVKKTFKRVEGRSPYTIDITDYLQGYQYNTHIADYGTPLARLEFFPTAEGYVNNMAEGTHNTSRVYGYVFNYTDHLGNIRLSYQDVDKNGSISSVDEILEENNYYPFGLKHEGYNVDTSQPDYKYKYNGKELQDELGLNMYDYGARNYDPALGRWMNIDPLAEQSRRWSPYTYAMNNPVFFIDPDGMSADWHRDLSGVLTADAGDTAESLSTYKGISVQEARAELNQSHYRYESVMSGGEKLYQSDRAVSSGDYGPSYGPEKDLKISLAICSTIAAPVLGASGAIGTGTSYLIGEAVAAFSQMTTETALTGITTNVIGQGVANGGDLSKTNVIEAGASAIPGIGPSLIGSTFNYNFAESDKGIQTPKTFEQATLQIGGGIIGNKFGEKVDANKFKGAAKVYGEVAKVMVGAGTGVLPNLAKK